ncbi:hypothetical protein ASPZODRAFT_132578 [Penicilliopsis zonata CBS 506.65]|uniref:Rhodopsin domain-containing protein n=1 Tax=Penicilliopsis zonata CBS 506.65 TaxID=1073090 RepID=A0A1L9SGX8_9EURO|nr:hypothetical protein ASPZODRAFT_132578 [Penicilliopsis zonata CBS 506.65]OJJ46500.1 hypothetical protein ASPZODRAFT_132578 [Penicilliopsis zonata CBS 506.65]
MTLVTRKDNIPGHGESLFVTAVVMAGLALFFVVLRLITRFDAHRAGADDYLIIVAMTFSIFLTIAIDLAVANGYGKRMNSLTTEEKYHAFLWFYIAQVPYKMVLGFTKMSIVCLYLRIFITPTFKRVCFGLIAVIACWTFATIMVTLFQCSPMAASWNAAITDKTCINKNVWWYTFAATDTLGDVVIFFLPIYPVLQLQLKPRDKLALLFVFALGAFVCTASIIRTVAVIQTSSQTYDESYDFLPRSVWTLIEANTGIICACLPMLKQYLVRFFPSVFDRSRQRTTDRYQTGTGYGQRSGNNHALQSLASGFRYTSSAKVQGREDATSEEMILDGPDTPEIHTTTNFEVSYEKAP